jgi:hypothetical protein
MSSVVRPAHSGYRSILSLKSPTPEFATALRSLHTFPSSTQSMGVGSCGLWVVNGKRDMKSPVAYVPKPSVKSEEGHEVERNSDVLPEDGSVSLRISKSLRLLSDLRDVVCGVRRSCSRRVEYLGESPKGFQTERDEIQVSRTAAFPGCQEIHRRISQL